ncbi:2-oxoacid:ferredoxin oxidoreductase subunit beta [Candidatus Bathyarchaeota archaeon]|nr:2-oxoacid:ferredoxin oxidoreductase subunit beta [Candidatus Bathyarchaeota archaeon]
MTELDHVLEDYLRMDRLPHIWCAGCGLGIILKSYVQALHELDYDLDKIVTVSGIGCAGRASGYVNTDAFHTTHGRALPFATGISVSKPELKPVVISGDGDLFAIGGNHLIHAARRNINMLVICSNNFNYGMTGAQYGPTTPLDMRTPTSPYGNIENPFNLVALVASSGATMVSRWTVYHVHHLKNSIKKGLRKKGFSFIEVLSPCTTGYGRLNKMNPIEMMRDLKDIGKIKKVHPTEAIIEPGKKIILGDFVDVEKPTYSDVLDQVSKRARE